MRRVATFFIRLGPRNFQVYDSLDAARAAAIAAEVWGGLIRITRVMEMHFPEISGWLEKTSPFLWAWHDGWEIKNIFWVYLGDSITKALFIQQFLAVLPMELSRGALKGRLEVRQPNYFGRKEANAGMFCSLESPR